MGPKPQQQKFEFCEGGLELDFDRLAHGVIQADMP
jgi:hypothetical protein